MKASNFGSSIFDYPVEQCVDYALTHGLNHFEINLTPDHSNILTFTDKRIAFLSYLAKKHQFSYSFHMSSSLNLGHAIPYFRQKHVNNLADCIKIGARLNLSHITFHLGNVVGHTIMNYFRQQSLLNVVKSLKILVQMCKACNVTLAIENSAKMHRGSDLQLLGDNIGELQTIFDLIESPWLGFCLDIGHANLNEGAAEYIQQFGNRLKCVHFHDNYGFCDEHLEVGNGSVNWQEIIDMLAEINFRGPFISECYKLKPHNAVALFKKFWLEKRQS